MAQKKSNKAVTLSTSPGKQCPFCGDKLKGTITAWIMHLYVTHPQFLPKVEDESYNPSARGKHYRDMTDEEYISLIKLLRKLEV